MSDFTSFVLADLRLVLLRTLQGETDHTLNEVLLTAAAERWGHKRTRDAIKAELRWLAEVGAVRVTEVEGYLIATLTRRGLDHVERRSFIDGVNRPGPEA
jgi:predicted transcriptional regulator